jgi:hypothetical protein
MTHFLMMI